MQDTFYLLGLASGVALSFFYDLVRRHQRRKRRERQRRQALVSRL